MAPCTFPGATQSTVEQFAVGHHQAVVGAVGSVSSSGSSLLILIFFFSLPRTTSLGFICSPGHPLLSPRSEDHPFLQGCPRTNTSRDFSLPHFIAFTASRCCVFLSLCFVQPLRAAVLLPNQPLRLCLSIRTYQSVSM